MLEWINPWITGSLSVFFAFVAAFLIIRENRLDKSKGPIETHNLTRENGKTIRIDLQEVGGKIRVVQIYQ